MKEFFKQIGNYIAENRLFISGFLWGMCFMSFINIYQSITDISESIEKMNANIEKLESTYEKD